MSKKNTLGISPLLRATRIQSDEMRTWNLPLKNMRATTISQNTGSTLTTEQLKGGWIVRDTLSPTANISDLLPTAALLISGLGLMVGDAFDIRVDCNNTASSFSYFFTIGSGGTFKTNSISVASGSKSTSVYRIIITSASTYDVYRAGAVTLA